VRGRGEEVARHTVRGHQTSNAGTVEPATVAATCSRSDAIS
jgi:hypothetical protein